MNAVTAQAHGNVPVTITLPVEGMTCASCVSRIERALTETDGVEDAMLTGDNARPAEAGIAIGTGTGIAIEAGDVILMSGDLRGLEAPMVGTAATAGTPVSREAVSEGGLA